MKVKKGCLVRKGKCYSLRMVIDGTVIVRALHNPDNSPCKTLQDARRAQAIETKALTLLSRKEALEATIAPFKILIDEEPSVFEGVSFASTETELLLETFEACLNDKVTQHLKGLQHSTKTGSIADYCYYTKSDLKTLKGRCSKLGNDEKETCYKYLSALPADKANKKHVV